MSHAYLFRRKLGFPLPAYDGTAGHVGWAFDLAKGTGICCGATENRNVHPWVPAGGDNSAWLEIVGSIADLKGMAGFNMTTTKLSKSLRLMLSRRWL